MMVILTSPKGRRYMAKPYSNGLCFDVYVENDNKGKPKRRGKNAGEEDTAEWKSLGKYPSDLHEALMTMLNAMLKDPEEKASIVTKSNDILAELKAINKAIGTYLKKIEREVVK